MKNFKPNNNFIYYLYFIVERQNIFWKRYNGEQPPYTLDETLQNHKFTNVYRVLDKVSQYLVKEIINKDAGLLKEDLFWKILIFKHFNKIETWEWFNEDFGGVNINTSIETIIESLNRYADKGGVPYSNAFLQTASFMASERFLAQYGLKKGCKKYEAYLKIFDQYFFEEGHLNYLLAAESLEDVFNQLNGVPGFAAFLSMQYTTDFNMSSLFNFDKNSFISASVGSIRGIDKTFDFEGKKDYSAVIKWVQQNLKSLLREYSDGYDMPLYFKPLGVNGKVFMPSVMDCQSLFCETDKYTRPLGLDYDVNGKGNKRIKQKFKQTTEGKLEIHLPNKWL